MSEKIMLAKEVLDNELGRKLIGVLEEETLNNKGGIVLTDTHIQYALLGKIELIMTLKRIMAIDENQLRDIIEGEKINNIATDLTTKETE
jgi:hypothetical protein